MENKNNIELGIVPNSVKRLSGEHFLIYFSRLLKMKEDKVIDIEKSEIYELVFGKNLSSCESRKRTYCFTDIIEKATEEGQDMQSIIEDINKLSNVKTEIEPIRLSEDEDRIQVIDMGSKFHIYNSKRSIVIDKDKVKKVKELYCDSNPLTINEICRKLDIARRDFMLLKQGLAIVHADVPFLDSEIQEDNIQQLVDETLERRKEKYFIKLQNEEIRQMKTELEKYRKQDYLFDKVVATINEIKIEPAKYNVEINDNLPYREALVDLADLHLGEKFENFLNKFNVEIAKERFNKLTQDVIKTCAENGVRVLHVSNLGDDITGIIHDSLIKESEIPVEEQIALSVELISKMLIEFSGVFDKVIYADTYGNHSRIFVDKSSDTEKSNFEFFISWGLRLGLQNEKYKDKIVFENNLIDGTIIVKNILGVNIYEVHGQYDRFASVASDLSMMVGKVQEIHIGHFHSSKSIEVHNVEVFQTRSFVGTNTYAKNKRVSSRAGQRLFIYEQGKRKYIEDIVLD